jgi:hypothetical protein
MLLSIPECVEIQDAPHANMQLFNYHEENHSNRKDGLLHTIRPVPRKCQEWKAVNLRFPNILRHWNQIVLLMFFDFFIDYFFIGGFVRFLGAAPKSTF